MQGTHYTDSHVTSGFANMLARPLLRERQRDDMSEDEAVALLHDALRVCYARDKQSINKFVLAKVRARVCVCVCVCVRACLLLSEGMCVMTRGSES
jgi:20S proteasome alpha/beta subunit